MAIYDNDPSFVFVEGWDKIGYLLQTTYRLSTKDICRRLQCSRSWVNKYVRPHVKHVYVATGFGGRSVPAALVLKNAGIIETEEATWYDEEGFIGFILSNSKFHQRSKMVYLENYVEDVEGWKNRCNGYFEARDEALGTKQFEKTMMKLNQLDIELRLDLKDYLSPQGKLLLAGECRPHRRTAADWVEVACPDETVSAWRTVADMKGYGDVDEVIHRRLFAEGCVRCTTELPDIDGQLGKKVFYVEDPDPNTPDEEKCLIGLEFVLSYSQWLRHK